MTPVPEEQNHEEHEGHEEHEERRQEKRLKQLKQQFALLRVLRALRVLRVWLFVAASITSAHAEDWPRWRGPQLDGISRETGWRETFPAEGPKVLWKVNVGTGYSSVAVADGRLFTLGNVENVETVYCLDAATGATIWKHSYEEALDPKFFEGGPTSTPTVDGEAVYTLSRDGDLFRFDAATGKVVWSINVAEAAGVRVPGWGFSSSPLVHGEMLLINAGEHGVAVNKADGSIVWKSPDRDPGYATVVPFQRGGKELAIVAGAKQFTAIDIATGKPLWSHRWLTRYGVNAADPIVRGDQVLISSGYGKGAALLQMPPPDAADGDPRVVWQNKDLRTQLAGGVLIDGHVYAIDGDTVDEAASLRCVEFDTGKVRWSESLGFSSLTAADGKLIVLTDDGELIIAPASPDGFKPTARTKVIDGPTWTVPVLANARIYCRNAAGDLVCVDVKM